MSNQEGDLQRSARRHPAAIWGIIAALALAALAFFIFAPADNPDDPAEHATPSDLSRVGIPQEAVTSTPGTATPATPPSN